MLWKKSMHNKGKESGYRAPKPIKKMKQETLKEVKQRNAKKRSQDREEPAAQ